MTIRAVFFDFGGVLLQHADGIDHKAIEARLGLEERTLFRCLYRDSRYMDYQVGGCTHEEWIESIRAAAQAIVGLERVEELMNTWQEAERLLNPLMISLVERLRAGGYRTGIISNTIPGMEERLAREFPHLITLFDVRIGSGDIGFAKPDPAIFEHALREMDVPAEASVFADDVRAYAEAARAVGMYGFHFTGYDQFASDLRSLGVQV
jgi:putative hydrolase of the HAD superfamily